MNSVLTPSLSERKRILDHLCREHPQWKLRSTVAAVLFVLAVVVLVVFAVIFLRNNVSGGAFAAFMAVALIIACIPYALGLWTKNSAKYTCALPYSGYANGTLMLNEDQLEYVFWKVDKRDPAAFSRKGVFADEGKYVFSIPKAEIRSLTISNDICTVTGPGQLHVAAWEDGPEVRKCAEFSFILAFDQKDASNIIQEWRK